MTKNPGLAEVKSILVVGGDSGLGAQLIIALRQKGHQVVTTTRRSDAINKFSKLEILNNEIISNIPETFQFDLIFMLISFENSLINAPISNDYRFVWNFFSHLLSVKGKVVFVSSAAVFNGFEKYSKVNDLKSGCSHYAKHKIAMEESLIRSQLTYKIIRLGKVFTDQNPILRSWINALKNNKEAFGYTNLYISPVSLAKVIQVLCRELSDEHDFESKIIQMSSQDHTSYFEILEFLREIIGAPHHLIGKAFQNQEFQGPYASLENNFYISNLENCWQVISDAIHCVV